LLRTAEVRHLMRHAADFGLKAEKISYDLEKVVARSRAVASQLSGGIRHLMKKNKVTVVDGHARLLGGGRIAVEADGKRKTEMSAPHIILATGARARSLPGLEPDGKLVWSYKEAMTPDKMPESLMVVG